MKTLTQFGLLSFFLLFTISCKKDKSAVTGDAKAVADTSASASYSVNTSESTVSWEGSKVASSHTGTFAVSGGNISMDKGKVVGGKFEIDMASLTCTDLKAGDGKEDLEGHLKSPDFFDIAAHPTATFVITKVTELAGDASANSLVYGNLNLKGVEKGIAFKAMINDKGQGVSVVSPEFSINRTDFGMKYGSATFVDVVKDRAINDNVKLSINLSAS